MVELKIDPEFEKFFPPCDAETDKYLEESILKYGVFSPIITWNGTIIDGRRRYRILQKHGNIPFEICKKHFNDRLDAMIWMLKNQSGRKNLSEQERMYLASKLKD